MSIITPAWIAEALAVFFARHGTANAEEVLTFELATRLPIEALTSAVTANVAKFAGDDNCARALAAEVVRDVVAVLINHADAIDLTRSYQEATAVLDRAGVPYLIDSACVYKPLDLAGRVSWLCTELSAAAAPPHGTSLDKEGV